jgi:hypothetical protein
VGVIVQLTIIIYTMMNSYCTINYNYLHNDE